MLLLISFKVLSEKGTKPKENGKTIHSSLGTLLQVFHTSLSSSQRSRRRKGANCSNDDTQTQPSYINQY